MTTRRYLTLAWQSYLKHRDRRAMATLPRVRLLRHSCRMNHYQALCWELSVTCHQSKRKAKPQRLITDRIFFPSAAFFTKRPRGVERSKEKTHWIRCTKSCTRPLP